MKLSRTQLLAEMGIRPLWRLREPGIASLTVAVAPGPSPSTAAAATVPLPQADSALRTPVQNEADWPTLYQHIHQCRACGLCQQRQRAVPGIGDEQADWLLIGEGPGAEEDERGEPFVGQAGKLLDNMLAALDLRRGEGVYIANAVKCRPPQNRTPTPEEMAACRPFLERQIQLLAPRIIVLLGKAAAASVLGEAGSLASLRGKAHHYQGIPVVVTYHPAYLLRNLPEKAKAWEDLLLARRVLRAASETT